MQKTQSLEKLQRYTACLSFLLITVLSFSFRRGFMLGASSMVEVWIARGILFGFEFLPALLLLVFTLMHRNPAWQSARWMPAALMGCRLVLEILAFQTGSFYEYDGLTFVSSFFGSFQLLVIIVLAVLLFTTLFCSRGTFMFSTLWVLFVTVCGGVWILLDIWVEFEEFLWFAAYLLWFLSTACLSSNLTEENRYIPAIGNSLGKVKSWLENLLTEILSAEDSEEDDDAPSVEKEYEVETYIRDHLYRKDTVLFRTPWDDIIILEANWDGSRYHIVEDEEHIRRVMDYVYGSDKNTSDPDSADVSDTEPDENGSDTTK